MFFPFWYFCVSQKSCWFISFLSLSDNRCLLIGESRRLLDLPQQWTVPKNKALQTRVDPLTQHLCKISSPKNWSEFQELFGPKNKGLRNTPPPLEFSNRLFSTGSPLSQNIWIPLFFWQQLHRNRPLARYPPWKFWISLFFGQTCV